MSEFWRHMIGALCTAVLGLIAFSLVAWGQGWLIWAAFIRDVRKFNGVPVAAWVEARGAARVLLALELVALLVIGAGWGTA